MNTDKFFEAKKEIDKKNAEKELERAARNYCDETGSMYFEYTDASNELIDAFKAGYEYATKR